MHGVNPHLLQKIETRVLLTIRAHSMLAEEELGHEKLLKQVYYDYKKRLGMKVLHPENGSES